MATIYFQIDSPYRRTVAAVEYDGYISTTAESAARSDLNSILEPCETIAHTLRGKPFGFEWTTPKHAWWCSFGFAPNRPALGFTGARDALNEAAKQSRSAGWPGHAAIMQDLCDASTKALQ